MTDEIIAPAACAALLAIFVLGPAHGPAAAQESGEETAERQARVEVRTRAPGPRADGGWLGVRVEDLDQEDASERGWDAPRGARVTAVTEESPAEEAGLRDGDVIVRFDGESVRSVAELIRLVRETPPGRTVDLGVARDGGERNLSVDLGERPGPRFRVFHGDGLELEMDEERMERLRKRLERAWEHWHRGMERMDDLPERIAPRMHMMRLGGPPRLGIRMHDLTDQLAEHFGVGEEGGVLVASVREGSPAAEAGLQAGDVVVRFDGEGVDDPHDLLVAVHGAEAGSVPMTVVRDGEERTVTVELPERRRPERIEEEAEAEGAVSLGAPRAPAPPRAPEALQAPAAPDGPPPAPPAPGAPGGPTSTS